jgi:hypothetical protein
MTSYTCSAVLALGTFRKMGSRNVAPVMSSRMNGTAARIRLNAIPPARKRTLSSPLLSQMRFA